MSQVADICLKFGDQVFSFFQNLSHYIVSESHLPIGPSVSIVHSTLLNVRRMNKEEAVDGLGGRSEGRVEMEDDMRFGSGSG
jgi:hypothetical protein